MSDTTVVNIMNDPFDVYIGRAQYNRADGFFGNPIKFDKPCPVCGKVHSDVGSSRDDLVHCYKIWFWKKVNQDVVFRNRVMELKGKRLGCFCHPRKCHGDVIKGWLEAGCPLNRGFQWQL